MSSGGDGGNFFDDLTPETLKGGNFFNNLIEDVVNVGVNTATFGTVGYKDGSLGTKYGVVSGTAGRAVVDGTKVITGAKAAEDANEMARQQFEEQKLAAEQERQNMIVTKGREQMRASQLAGAARRAGTNVTGNLLGTNEKDFLGL